MKSANISELSELKNNVIIKMKNFTDSKDDNFFKFSIDIKEELEDRDEFKIYRVVLKYRESVDKNFKEIGEGKIKIDKVKEKEEKS